MKALFLYGAAMGFALSAALAQSPAPAASPAPSATPSEPISPAVLEKYDVNKNGVLDPDELAAYNRDAPARKAEKLRKYDKNGDGKLDDNEKIQMRVDQLREQEAALKRAAAERAAKPVDK